MANNTPNGVMSTQEKREMHTAFQFSIDSAGEVERIIHKFENMWGISLWWDSKIPVKRWRWYYCASITTSNPEKVKEEISSYLEFYQEMSEIGNWINEDEARSETERKELQTAICDLREKLQEMLKKAEKGKRTTSSSAVYRLHRGFITNYKKLECMIKDMQLVSLKEVVDTAYLKIDDLEKELKEFDRRYDDLKKSVEEKLAEQERKQDQKLAEQKREQDQKLAEQKREQNQKLAEQKREQDQKLAEQSEQMSRKFEETFAHMVEQNNRLVEQNKQILEHLRNMQENQAKLEEDKRKLEKEKDRLEIENDFLLVMNGSNLQETTKETA